MTQFEFGVWLADSCRGGFQAEVLREQSVGQFVRLLARIIFADLEMHPASTQLSLAPTALVDTERFKRCLVGVSGVHLDEMGANRFDAAYTLQVYPIRLADRQSIEVIDVRNTDTTTPKLITEKQYVQSAKRLVGAVYKDIVTHRDVINGETL